MAERLVGRVQARLRELKATLEGQERLSRQLAPAQTLRRGFSLTRDAAGRLLTESGRVTVGDRITTELARGHLASRVEET